MKKRTNEVVFVTVSALLFFGAFLALAYFDKPHGDIGSDYGTDQVDLNIGDATGQIDVPQLPTGLYIFGAGQEASLELSVVNNDPDNDIDTIYVTIPGSVLTDVRYQWYEQGFDHEWNSTIETDMATLVAQDDYAGANFGGSAQYDTAGGVDDALDHDPDEGISEGLDIDIDFTAPTEPGFKIGAQAMNLEVADEKTEDANARMSFAPFPFPYLVAGEGSEYLVMVLTGNAHLGLFYEGQSYFGPTRASDMQTFSNGIKFVSDSGKQVITMDKPGEGKVAKPLISPPGAGTLQFTLDVFEFTVPDLSLGEVDTEPIVSSYTETPRDPTQTWDLDIDNDGIYNSIDDDADNDGYTKDVDPDDLDPQTLNMPPTGADATTDKDRVEVGYSFVLTANATDPEGDDLVYTWTVDRISTWSVQGKTVTIFATDPFVPGTYTFTVSVSDGISSSRSTDIVTVIIEEEEVSPELPLFLIIIIIIVAMVIIVTLVYFFVLRGKDDMEETPEMMGPEPTLGVEAPSIDEKVSDEGGIAEMEEDDEIEITEEMDIPIAASVGTAKAPAPPTEESEDVQELEQLIEDLERTEEEIQDLCPECGSPLGPTDSSCPSCGTEFELALECPNCGAVVEDKASHCPSCGIQFI